MATIDISGFCICAKMIRYFITCPQQSSVSSGELLGSDRDHIVGKSWMFLSFTWFLAFLFRNVIEQNNMLEWGLMPSWQATGGWHQMVLTFLFNNHLHGRDARCCPEHFTNINSVNHHNKSMSFLLWSPLTCQTENWGMKILSHLFRVT